ncbi:PREDICTED: uncharacterized protein LOC105570352 [Vollenhovia emeryi]|uniref:uncharacterized protein LOC105570352 n=1 Tax=Vollenhovia emeryi TaxID=411798 RepID=UPI0005F496D2|nr:PREDICTED: uncharacterized protein LOC105570352 [Vollenhovia emeryi]
MRLYAVALIAWAALITASSEHNTANLNDEKAVDYTDLPAKQIVQPYVTDVGARSSEQTGAADHSDDFANAGLSRSAVHADEERGSSGVSTTDSSSPGSIYATPLSGTSIRLESTDKYPFRDYPSHGTGYTEDVLLVESAGNFGEKVQDHPRDRTIVRTVIRTSEGEEDDGYTSQKPYSSTASSREDKDNRERPYASGTREPFVLALKDESNLADDSSSDDTKIIRSEIPAVNSDEIFSEVTTENSTGNIVSILENDVVPEILPTPQARLSRAHNTTTGEKPTEKSIRSAKKSENVKTSTTVEIVPSLQARFSSPIVVADLPDRETQETAVDYMDDASDTYRPAENAEIISEANAEGSKITASASITSSAMLNPLQVGITLMNADQARLTDNSEQSAAINIEDYPQDDLQRLATADKDPARNIETQPQIDYQGENFDGDEVEKRVEVDIQKVPNDSVEIQKSIELYHTAPVHEIHYPPEYIQQTANLGVIETNNIGNLPRSKQPYDQVEQSELRPTYDIYQGNDQGEKSAIKAHTSTFPQKLNRHEYNALEDDVGRPSASAVGAEYSSSTHEQPSLELQPYKYSGIQSVLLAPSQFDDTLYDQSNVRHNFNGNDNGIPPRAKPVVTSTRQETASEPVKPYVPSTYQYSVQQSHQPYDHQPPIRSPEVRRPEVQQLLLRIIPEGSSANGGFLVPLPRPYPFEIEKKIPVERLVEKKVQMQVPVQVPVPVPVPQPYPVHVQVEKPIRLPQIYPLHIERVVEKRVPYTVQRLVVQPPSYPLHVRLPPAYPTYAAAPIEQPAHATVPIEKATEKPAAPSRPSRPYRTNVDRPADSSGPSETRFTKYYQKPQEAIYAGENANHHGIAGGLTFVPQPPQSETNTSQFYNVPYGRPSTYDYNIDVGKNYVPTAHFSNIKLVILPKKFGSHVILRPHTPSYTIPSFGRQILYNLVEKDKAVKDEYVGPAPPRKTSQGKVYPQIKSPLFSTSAAQSLAGLRKSRQPETQGSFRQSKMEYGFKPPMIPSIQYDENTASKVEN